MSEQPNVSVLLLKRNCSFTPKQVGQFYLSMVLFSSVIASYFYWQGAWMIIPFACIELLVLGIALLIYSRHATDYEKITIKDGMMHIEIVNGSKKIEKQWPLLWLRIRTPIFSKDTKVSKDPKNNFVTIEHADESIFVGSHTLREKRKELADKIRRARELGLH